jgi:hypothetical protein
MPHQFVLALEYGHIDEAHPVLPRCLQQEHWVLFPESILSLYIDKDVHTIVNNLQPSLDFATTGYNS